VFITRLSDRVMLGSSITSNYGYLQRLLSKNKKLTLRSILTPKPVRPSELGYNISGFKMEDKLNEHKVGNKCEAPCQGLY
jgi:hypothetical protein